MAYDNINSSISRCSKKIIFMWIIFSIFTLICAIFYYQINRKNNLLKQHALFFTEINSEAALLFGNNSSIDTTKTSLNSWKILHKNQFINTLPAMTGEIDILEDLGDKFYSSLENKNSQNKSNAYNNFFDQIELLKRMISNITDASWIDLLTTIFIPIYIGFLLICIFFTINLFNHLSKKIISKNSMILENFWEDIQSIEYNECQESRTNDIKLDNKVIDDMLLDSKQMSHIVSSLQDNITKYINKTKDTTIHVDIENKNKSDHIDSKVLEDKISLVQKLLSRLFTRAERASTLAKASSDNGFQAGILALNISIEASKTGESGKAFLPISDRVKTFAEKSSNIGHAIIEELRDADLAIRKAYAVGKNILETLPKEKNQEEVEHSSISVHPEIDFSDLHQTTSNLEQVININIKIQNQCLELQQILESTLKPSVNSTPNILLLKESIIKNFEDLYRTTYGVDPIISQDYHR